VKGKEEKPQKLNRSRRHYATDNSAASGAQGLANGLKGIWTGTLQKQGIWVIVTEKLWGGQTNQSGRTESRTEVSQFKQAESFGQ